MSIKAIETCYKGYRFRSRLEARWAVFFDALGVAWEYEREGFEIDKVRYLPDFYLPDSRLWVEIKADTPSQKEADKIFAFTRETKDNFLLVFGQPYLGEDGSAYKCEYYGLFFPAGKLFADRTGLTGLALCTKCGALWRMLEKDGRFTAAPIGSSCGCGVVLDLPYEAYAKARSARFEHGETPN